MFKVSMLFLNTSHNKKSTFTLKEFPISSISESYYGCKTGQRRTVIKFFVDHLLVCAGQLGNRHDENIHTNFSVKIARKL